MLLGYIRALDERKEQRELMAHLESQGRCVEYSSATLNHGDAARTYWDLIGEQEPEGLAAKVRSAVRPGNLDALTSFAGVKPQSPEYSWAIDPKSGKRPRMPAADPEAAAQAQLLPRIDSFMP